jgi:hypothetical protein
MSFYPYLSPFSLIIHLPVSRHELNDGDTFVGALVEIMKPPVAKTSAGF